MFNRGYKTTMSCQCVDFDTDDFLLVHDARRAQSRSGARTLPVAVDELKRVLLDVATGLQAAR